jgi:glycosyltransferase involved in cell wall biosynthesis
MSDINDVAFENFGMFIFTSYFEGLPNVVLEMAHRGIPIIASDVGGLRETFSKGEIDLISMEGNAEQIADRFVKAIQQTWEMSEEKVLERMDAARKAVEVRHGRRQFIENVADLVGGAI